ncbi:feruloyl-CoA synthase [Geobacter argillaceus]|uniref:Trans-feruloyl-CoA synthase n=1 Tax=Geobacter argillaceus TaxID=345631 RepID=A0A562WQJ4_9BACT|nr:feruloyl-CoA synthase [Geobacter argillaceus]TWJ32620.1 trans-feruloyl-CoA synthase [Geobacter argillaceus]
MNQAEIIPLDFAPAVVNVRETTEGGYLLSSPMPLERYEECLGGMLRHWTEETPEKTFLGERDTSGQWNLLTYGEAGCRADAIAQAFIDRNLGDDRPVMILSGNSIGHALLTLGGFIAGVPVVPVSAAYSLLSQDFAKLKYIFSEVRPALLYVERADLFGNALAALDLSGVEVVTAGGQTAHPCTPLSTLLETAPTQQVEQRFSQVDSSSIAKILFSSGSTGIPKGVLNSHGMLCANQQMMAQVWPFTKKTPPILVDWLPWSHTFGGNHNFNMVLKRGGTLYIDGGKPVPGMVEQTVKNLAEISPTIYFNVPAGFAMLLPFLENDESLRNNFFRRLQLIFYAAAALPQDLWQRLETVSLLATGRKVPMTSSWGATETAPAVTSAHFPIDKAGVIGIPLPGVTLKMVPYRGKFELRVKGPNVTPGYLHRPDLTAAAFDEDGFYRIGDAGAFADPTAPGKGITFNGRVAEDFKLSTGTWVHVGPLRLGVLTATAPVLQDVLVTGHDRDYVGILAWPNIQGCKGICQGTEGTLPAEELLRSKKLVDYLRKALRSYNAQQEGSATRVHRIMLMTVPPSIDANEITDKGYINQRAALEMRKELVAKLHARKTAPEVILV